MSLIKKRAWAEVNLDAISHNLAQISKFITRADGTRPKILAVVKADAYGHGFLEVTKTLLDGGADALGVAFIDEAVQLRRSGIEVPILILGHTPKECVCDAVDLGIMPTVFNIDIACALSEYAVASGKTAKIHIKIDTGMNRVGFWHDSKSTIDDILTIYNMPNIIIDGIFTHFSTADEEDFSYTDLQYSRFLDLCQKLEGVGVVIPTKHCCNSGGTINFPHMHMDMIRPGIILYGLYPSPHDKKIKLEPAMSLKAVITHIKNVFAGEPISYGRKYITKSDCTIATIPIGYADGYSSLLTGKARVLVLDESAPVLGKICMDQCMIDVSLVKNVNIGDEVVVFGKKGDKIISVEDIAAKIGTINYEVLCIIGRRIPRVYIQNKKIVEVLNYLDVQKSR